MTAGRKNVPVTHTDVTLLTVLTEFSRGRPVSLEQFVDGVDWYDRAIPSFDEVSYGLRRLQAAGLLAVSMDSHGRLLLGPTREALHLRRSANDADATAFRRKMEESAGVGPFSTPEQEDRTYGPLAGLRPEAYEVAVSEHSEAVARQMRPWADLLRRVGTLLGWHKDPR
jgi:hypothetical protein